MKGKSICYFSNRKPECKEIAELACICGGEIHSFCSIHYENHLKNSSVTHSLIPNRQSSRILNKSSNSKISKLQEIDQDLIIYKDQLVNHINSIESISNSFIDMAKEISEFPTNRCNQSLNEVNSFNKNIQKLLRSSESKNQDFIQKYNAEGLKGVLKNYLEVNPYSINHIMISLGSKLGVEIHNKKELEAKFRQLRDTIEENERELEGVAKFRKLKKSSEQENFRLQEEVNKYKVKIEELNQEMQSTFSHYQAQEKCSEQENLRLKEELNKHERQIDELKREMEATFKHYQGKEKRSKQMIFKLRGKVNKYERKIDELNQEMQATFCYYQGKEKSLKQEIFRHKAYKVEELKNKLIEKEMQIENLNTLFRIKTQELDRLTIRFNQQQAEIRNKEQQIKELKHKLAFMGEKIWKIWRLCKRVTYYSCIPALIMSALIVWPKLKSSVFSSIK